MAEAIRFDQVCLRRGEKQILDQIDWQVSEGQHWVIVGPNGAGKTTALQLAATRLHPTSGRVYVLGHQLGRVDVFELRGRVGLCSAALSGRIPPGESALDAVVTAAYGVTGRWREAYGALDMDRGRDLLGYFGVGELAGRTFGTLSEGEKKRVQLARAMMSDPEVLLLDEPGAGLDLAGRERLVATLAALAANPQSPLMVLVTHHLEEVPAGFSHAALMSGGHITAQGLIDDVLTSQNVSEAYGMGLTVGRHGERFWATAA